MTNIGTVTFRFLSLANNPFFFNVTATAEIYTYLNTLSLHDALPIYSSHIQKSRMPSSACDWSRLEEHTSDLLSHSEISYAVFCLKKKKKKTKKNKTHLLQNKKKKKKKKTKKKQY